MIFIIDICICNSFVDRDMFMRFRGGGVGHRTTREATNVFLSDRDRLDVRHVSATDCSNDNESAKLDECDIVDYAEGPAAQVEAFELPAGESDQPDSDDDYGYSGLRQEVEGEDDDSDDGEDDDAIEGNEGNEIDDELGAEDGEDGEDGDEELEGFSKL
jgi:hypothetical protein